jgi:nucleoid-associated protein YgaU
VFFRGSRYEAIANAELITADDRVIRYKRVRFIPETRGVIPHIIAQGDRLDLISYKVYRDPEQFWRICDANRALRPDELLARPGRHLLIPIPLG